MTLAGLLMATSWGLQGRHTHTHRLTHIHMNTYIHISTHARLFNRGGSPQGSSPSAKPTCPLSGLFPPACSGKDSKMTVVTLSLKGLESHVVICIKVRTQKYLCKLSNNHSHTPWALTMVGGCAEQFTAYLTEAHLSPGEKVPSPSPLMMLVQHE